MRKGTNRVSASHLQALSHTLQVPVAFSFEAAPHAAGARRHSDTPSPAYVENFLASGAKTRAIGNLQRRLTASATPRRRKNKTAPSAAIC